ncbi:MAG: hypothetical protein K2L86_07035 [Lachnospiraceae bacterium]|nr:hypothetical protein [Lachnospiraceae bacterium]
MPYREALMADAKKQGEEVFDTSIRILEAEYQKPERRNEAGQIFTDLFAQWGEYTKEKAACLGICYLHSSILMRTGEIRLTLYGQGVYMDTKQLEKTWQPSCFFQQYEQDMTALMNKLRKEHPRIYPYEEDTVRFLYAEYYYAALEALCRDMLEEIEEYEAFQKMNRTEDFYMFFGRWRGEAEKLLCTETI